MVTGAGLAALMRKRLPRPEQSIKDAHTDINAGMIYSNIVAAFIVVTTAATLGAHGKHDIATAQDAAQALRPLAGNFAALLFTLGMVGTGVLAVPVLATSSASVAAETFSFREGLSEKPRRAKQFYGVIIGVAMDLLKIDPIKALFWSAILNGISAVPLIAVIARGHGLGLLGRIVVTMTSRSGVERFQTTAVPSCA
jgi:Mn2+/Fe2+ NRAMP family transporter